MSETTRRPYRRETRYPATVRTTVTEEALAGLEAVADAHGQSMAAATRDAIDAGLAVLRRQSKGAGILDRALHPSGFPGPKSIREET